MKIREDTPEFFALLLSLNAQAHTSLIEQVIYHAHQVKHFFSFETVLDANFWL